MLSCLVEFDIGELFLAASSKSFSIFHIKLLKFNSSAQVEVGHVREIDEIFDAISYKKGAAIIRMLQTYLGADQFQVCFCMHIAVVLPIWN